MVKPSKIDLARGARISALRDAKGLGLGELARRVGVDPKSVNNWQRGLPISPGHLLALADALGVKPRYITHGEEHARAESAPSSDVRAAVGRQERLLEDHDLRTRTQLARIEATLAELDRKMTEQLGRMDEQLEGVAGSLAALVPTPSEELVAVVEEEAQRRDPQPPPPSAASKRKKGKGQAG